MHRRLALAIAAIVTLGSALAAQKPDADIEALTRNFEQAFNKGDAKALAGLYTKDAVQLTPDGQFLTGQAAVEQHHAKVFGGPAKDAKLTLKLGRTQEVTPDVRISEGTYEVTGGTMPGTGRYVNTVARQGGQWRLASVVVVPDATGTQKPGVGTKPGGSR
jgi:uncharacterized protein (TIGR02246 family)